MEEPISAELVAELEEKVVNATYASAIQAILTAVEDSVSYAEIMSAIGAYDSYVKTYGTGLLDAEDIAIYDDLDDKATAVTEIIDAVAAITAPYDSTDRAAIENIVNGLWADLDGTAGSEQDIFTISDYYDAYEVLYSALLAVENAETAIDNLTGYDDTDLIKEAKAKYDSLGSDVIGMLGDDYADTLATAYETITATQDAAVTAFEAAVTAAYNAPSVEAIEALIATYEAFTTEQQSAVYSYIKGHYDELVIAKATIALFDAIDLEDLDSASITDVNAALTDYNDLTPDEQDLVDLATDSKTTTLSDAYDVYNTFSTALTAIPAETTADGYAEKVEAAKIAYEALSDVALMLLSDTQKNDVADVYAAYDELMDDLGYNDTATTDSTTVVVTGIATVETGDTPGITSVTVSVVAEDSSPVITPTPTEDTKEEILSVDVKLMVEKFDSEGALVSSEEVQPTSAVTVKLLLPSGYDLDTLEIWHVKDSGAQSQITAYSLVTDGSDNYAIFQTESFSHFVFFAEVATEEDSSDNVGGSGSSGNMGTIIDPDATTTTTTETTTDTEEPVATVGGFDDVFEGDYYADAVEWAVENGITTGRDDTTFDPNTANTRAEAVTFLWRTMGSPESSGENPFEDLDEDGYYYEAVLWAVENDITVGTSDTAFSPDETCTRAHIVTFLWRMIGELDADTDNIFDDVSDDDYYFNAVLWAVMEEITNGMDDSTFAPNQDCTRAQIVTFLYRYFG